MQAIETKFIPASNFRGSRYKATACAGSVTVSADDRLNTDENHAAVAKALCAKFGWQYGEEAGVLKSGSYVHSTRARKHAPRSFGSFAPAVYAHEQKFASR